MTDNIYDLTIIGGGPVGIYGAFYSGMRGMKTKIIDALPKLGGQLSAIYPEKYIYDLPGHPKVQAAEMVDKLKEQMQQYEDKINIATETAVKDVEKLANGTFKIHSDKDCHYSRSVIITAGNGAFTPRKLSVKNMDQYVNIHYFVSKMDLFKDKEVVIFGGGDSAVDWSLMLEGIAKKITIIHRRQEFRAQQASIEKLQKSKVNILTPYVAQYLVGTDGYVQAIEVSNVKTNETQRISADEVIVLFGFISSLGPIKDWHLEINKNSLSVDHRQQTSVSGIYAAGDACTFDGKVKMITTGLGEVVVAVNAAVTYAYPDNSHPHKHSSS